MALTIGTATNAIDLLKLILQYQNYGDNVMGSVSSNAKINEDSFNSSLLDPVRAVPIRFQIKDFDSANTDSIIQDICKQFSLVQYTDINGYECVKYLFAEETSIRTITKNEMLSIDSFNAIDPTICASPNIKYNYDYASETFLSELIISNIQMSTYDESYTDGFDLLDGEYFWGECKKLYDKIKHIEDIDEALSENKLIVDYTGAKFRLSNLIRLYNSPTLKFTVPYQTGWSVYPGDQLYITLPDLDTTEDTFRVVVLSAEPSIANNEASLEVMFFYELSEQQFTVLQNTYNVEADNLQDSFDDEELHLNTTSNGITTLTYSDPQAKNVHITQMNDDEEMLLAEMDNCQQGIATNRSDKPMMHKDENGNSYYGLNIGPNGCCYFGNPSTDGTIRFRISSGVLYMEKRVNGLYSDEMWRFD
jgi:hypothetical protein